MILAKTEEILLDLTPHCPLPQFSGCFSAPKMETAKFREKE